jgi:hypothetical protein
MLGEQDWIGGVQFLQEEVWSTGWVLFSLHARINWCGFGLDASPISRAIYMK